MKFSTRIPPFFFAALATFFWAGNAIVGKIAAGEIPPFTLSLWRWLVAALLILPFTWKPFWQQRQWYLENRWLAFLLAFLSVSVYNSLQYLALNYTSPANIGIVAASMPIFILLMSSWMNRQVVQLNQIIGILLALAGVIQVLTMGNNLVLAVNPGDLIMLTAVVSFSLYSVLLKRIPSEIHAGGLLLVLMGLGIIGILPFYCVDLIKGVTWDATLPANWLIIAFVALFPSITAYFAWNHAVKKGGPVLTGLSINLLPVFTLSLAFLILGDPISPSQVLAALLIFSGIALGLKPTARRLKVRAK